jgi:2,4-dienoyl-CoA reductase-like NADH-dependent reductase (Old Yellow Enzyme family)
MKSLFERAQIGELVLPNRLVRSATGERAADDQGRATEDLLRITEKLAEGEVGLIILGHAFVHPMGRASLRMTGIHQDDLIPGLSRITEAVHKYASKVALQINHAGRQTSKEIIASSPLAPSVVSEYAPEGEVKVLNDQEIEEIIECFAQAARRAKEAGFDAVQIHGAHGYLASQFLSPMMNRRQDKWGGTLAERMHFLQEVVRRVRKLVGAHFPLLIKLNADEFIAGGLSVEEACAAAKMLEAEGIDAIEISGGIRETAGLIVRKDIDAPEKEAYFLPYARKFRQATSLPLILVGGLRTLAVMERILRDEEADFISMCRPFIRQPDLARQLKAGETAEASCISCSRCSGAEARQRPVFCPLDETA